MFTVFKGFGDEKGYEAQGVRFEVAPDGRRGNCLPRSISMTLVLRVTTGEAEAGEKLFGFAAQQNMQWSDQGKGELSMYSQRGPNGEGSGLIRTIKFEGATVENLAIAPSESNYGEGGEEAQIHVTLAIWAAKVSTGEVEFVAPRMKT